MFNDYNSYGIYNVTTEVSEKCAHTRARSQECVIASWSMPTVISGARYSSDIYTSDLVHAAADRKSTRLNSSH